MPARKMIAVTSFDPGSAPFLMKRLMGRRIATPLVPPSPGSTPMTSPSTIATKSMRMLIGCRAVAKPPASWPKTSIQLEGEDSLLVEDALRQADAKADLERDEDDERKRDQDERDPPDLVSPDPPREPAHVQRRRDVEAEPRDHRVDRLLRPPADPADQRRVDEHRKRELEDGEEGGTSGEHALSRLRRRERAVRDNESGGGHDRRRPERIPARADVAGGGACRRIERGAGIEHGDGGDQNDRRRRRYLVGPHERLIGPT